MPQGPEKRKGEQTPREAPAEEPATGREQGARPDIDAREEEGYDQPESSAQKQPAPGPQP